MAKAGRTPLSRKEKAKRKTARDYRYYLEIKQLSLHDINSSRVGNKKMGRKPIPITEQRSRAKSKFLNSLNEYRNILTDEQTVIPKLKIMLLELRGYRLNDAAGRKKANRTISLIGYVKKQRELLELAEASTCSLQNYSGRGRKPMSKVQKIEHYQQKIKDAQTKIEDFLSSCSKSEQLYYYIVNSRDELTRVEVFLKSNPDDENANHLKDHLLEGIPSLEKAYQDALIEESQPSNMPNDRPPNNTLSEKNDAESTSKLQALRNEQVLIDEEIKILNELELLLRKKLDLLERNRAVKVEIERLKL
jgi:hypothetical protein